MFYQETWIGSEAKKTRQNLQGIEAIRSSYDSSTMTWNAIKYKVKTDYTISKNKEWFKFVGYYSYVYTSFVCIYVYVCNRIIFLLHFKYSTHYYYSS